MKNIPQNQQPDDPDEFEDEIEFIPCDQCDGHDACADFGCAIAAGLGRLVKKENPWDWD